MNRCFGLVVVLVLVLDSVVCLRARGRVGSWSQFIARNGKAAFHEPPGAAGILPADQSEESTAGKMPQHPQPSQEGRTRSSRAVSGPLLAGGRGGVRKRERGSPLANPLLATIVRNW